MHEQLLWRLPQPARRRYRIACQYQQGAVLFEERRAFLGEEVEKNLCVTKKIAKLFVNWEKLLIFAAELYVTRTIHSEIRYWKRVYS